MKNLYTSLFQFQHGLIKTIPKIPIIISTFSFNSNMVWLKLIHGYYHPIRKFWFQFQHGLIKTRQIMGKNALFKGLSSINKYIFIVEVLWCIFPGTSTSIYYTGFGVIFLYLISHFYELYKEHFYGSTIYIILLNGSKGRPTKSFLNIFLLRNLKKTTES